jgi:hypothetical protein
VTGCFLTVVVAFLAACVLIPLLSTKDTAGNITLSHEGAGIIGALSILLGLGLWILMTRIAKKFVSFSRRRSDPWL